MSYAHQHFENINPNNKLDISIYLFPFMRQVVVTSFFYAISDFPLSIGIEERGYTEHARLAYIFFIMLYLRYMHNEGQCKAIK